MSVNVDLDKLKSFVAVGEELHFTRAAQTRLHVSQPWLSRSVKSLESKLGVQLFERHSRHVELTAPGRRLLYGARKIIHDFDRTVSAVVRERKDNGRLTVGYTSYVDLRFMTELQETVLSDLYGSIKKTGNWRRMPPFTKDYRGLDLYQLGRKQSDHNSFWGGSERS